MPTTEFGNVRELWLATLDAPATKYSFLVRDEASVKSGAIFGRTLRLGQPVTLGPNSTWRQTSWEGGQDQDVWQDEQMYKSGDADSVLKRGKLRLWSGFTQVIAHPNRAVSRYLMSPGTTGWGADTPLYLVENNDLLRLDGTNGTTTPPSGWALYKWNPATSTASVEHYFAAMPSSMARLNDAGGSQLFLAVGSISGHFWTVNTSPFSVTLETTHTARIEGITAYGDALYYGVGPALYKRTYTVGAGTITHSKVKDIPNATQVRGLAVWNNRLWFASVGTGNRSVVHVSDGVTTTAAFSFPHDFQVRDMVVHYGALYIVGETAAALGSSGNVGQVWKYNGASLTKVHEEGTGRDGRYYSIWGACSYDRYLVWGKPGFPTGAGLMFYDAEVDAIVQGPTLTGFDPSATFVWAPVVIQYNNTVVASFYDSFDYGLVGGVEVDRPTLAAYWNRDAGKTNDTMTGWGDLKGRSFQYAVANAGAKEQTVLSSSFDGDVPGEQKSWLVGRVHCKVPQNTEVKVYVLLDESSTETLVKTITYDAAKPNFSTHVFPLKDADGTYMSSTTIRYKLVLRHTNRTDSASTANPEVDTMEVDYMPKPRKRRQWRDRVVCADTQKRLDGTNNPLNTTALLKQKLEDLFSNQEPILLWPSRSTAGAPEAGVEVMITEWSEQPSRVESDGTAEIAEVQVTFTEVVTA